MRHMSNNSKKIRKPFVFYGWLIVAMAGIRGSFGVGTYFTSSVLLFPMQMDLGWSRTTLVGVITMRQLGAGLLAPIVGAMADHRWLPRVILPISTLFLGASFISVKWIQTPAHFYLVHGILGTLGIALAGNAILDALVAKWFVRKRAQALMWANVGPGTGPLIFPVIVTALLAAVGWRDTWFWLGIGTIIVLFPLSLLARGKPEDMGLVPDGPPDGEGSFAKQGPIQPNEVSFTRAEAMRTRAFWLILGALSLGMFSVQGYQIHWIPYLREQNFSPQTAANAVFIYGIFTVVARFVWGFLSARYKPRYVLAAQSIAAALGVILFMSLQNTFTLMVWAVYQGLTLAAFFQLHALIAANYFGREHAGSVRGAMLPIAIGFNSSSPIVLSLLRDWLGTYMPALIMLVAMWIASAALIFFAKPPSKSIAQAVTLPD